MGSWQRTGGDGLARRLAHHRGEPEGVAGRTWQGLRRGANNGRYWWGFDDGIDRRNVGILAIGGA
jgi:hypothetical protein